MKLFGRFGRKMKGSGEITLQGIQANTAKLDEASDYFLQCFGPGFTGIPEGHIVTDIAGASAIAGLMALRSTGIDLSKHKPGSVILGEEIHQKEDPIFRYITAICHNLGVDPGTDVGMEANDKNAPLFEPVELTRRLEEPFYAACKKSGIEELYYPIVAALTALKLIRAGKETGLLDPHIGKSISMFYVVAGGRTVPHNNPS